MAAEEDNRILLVLAESAAVGDDLHKQNQYDVMADVDTTIFFRKVFIYAARNKMH